jgi:hypothetical protein
MNSWKKASPLLATVFCVLVSSLLWGADSLPQVQLNTASASPRSVETQTQQSILRDYTAAWKTLTQSLDENSAKPLASYFVGNAKDMLTASVTDQQKSGVHSRYLNQSHDVKAVFYGPEGDVIELRDTLNCQVQVLDGDKVVYSEPVVLHYIVLMTPGADRWVVRQMQSVHEF